MPQTLLSRPCYPVIMLPRRRANSPQQPPLQHTPALRRPPRLTNNVAEQQRDARVLGSQCIQPRLAGHITSARLLSSMQRPPPLVDAMVLRCSWRCKSGTVHRCCSRPAGGGQALMPPMQRCGTGKSSCPPCLRSHRSWRGQCPCPCPRPCQVLDHCSEGTVEALMRLRQPCMGGSAGQCLPITKQLWFSLMQACTTSLTTHE
jgi:hypothetical protein